VSTPPAPGTAGLVTPHSPPANLVLARNAGNLVLGRLGTMVLGILFNAAVGRALGAGDFGLYVVVSSFSTFALVLVDWGQHWFGIREVARAPHRGGDLLGTGLVLRAAGAALFCVPTALTAWALGYDRRTIGFAVAFLALGVPFFLAQGFGMVFRGRDRMGLDAVVSVANRAVGLLLAVAALALGLRLSGVVVAQGLAGIAALAVAFRLYRNVSSGPLRFSGTTAREILAGGTAILAMTLITNVQPYIDAVLLSKLVPGDAVGWYGAAKSLMGTLLAPPLILSAAAFPLLSRAERSANGFGDALGTARRPVIWLGGLAAVGTWRFAELAIRVVYGPGAFAPAGIILAVFGLGLLIVYIDVLLGAALIALGRSATFAGLKLANVALVTALELWLIPHFQASTGNGGLGVVTSFVLCEVLLFGGLLLVGWSAPRARLLLDAAMAACAALLTALLLQLWSPLSLWLGVPLCVGIYVAVTSALGLLRIGDLRTLIDVIRRTAGRSSGTSAVGSRPAPLR
jgi:O-antigen/teichoic acid export membrane protein